MLWLFVPVLVFPCVFRYGLNADRDQTAPSPTSASTSLPDGLLSVPGASSSQQQPFNGSPLAPFRLLEAPTSDSATDSAFWSLATEEDFNKQNLQFKDDPSMLSVVYEQYYAFLWRKRRAPVSVSTTCLRGQPQFSSSCPGSASISSSCPCPTSISSSCPGPASFSCSSLNSALISSSYPRSTSILSFCPCSATSQHTLESSPGVPFLAPHCLGFSVWIPTSPEGVWAETPSFSCLSRGCCFHGRHCSSSKAFSIYRGDQGWSTPAQVFFIPRRDQGFFRRVSAYSCSCWSSCSSSLRDPSWYPACSSSSLTPSSKSFNAPTQNPSP